MSNKLANDIKNNIEKIIYNPCYTSSEQDLNELLKECLRMANLLVSICEEKGNENNQ